ncbi:helix-turn-helix transcriptional regulator [Actinophytocola sp.]|uniref:helix-turn-helix domain-containing protein n=1 Tax=Actinophytocola sp. TaxID=1872138 RepID=UPI0025BAD894|nr:helix-turn-helix transcriptional regulator [Actinophytocola sp.]
MAESFGMLLRKLRTEAGISLGELARRIIYSKGHVSKIENGLQRPSAMFAKLCDRALSTDGVLTAAVQPASSQAVEPPDADGGVWVMELDETGGVRFNQVSRRTMLAGAGVLLGSALTRGAGIATDEHTLTVLRSAFYQHRELGMMASPRVVLAPAIAQVHALRTLAAGNPEPMRSELLRLASRVAEFAGWMSQEAGQEGAALWWTDRAVELAAAGRDPHLASFALVRRAELAMYRHDPVSTVGLTQQAQRDPAAGSRILGLAAQFEAQGHALAGDLSAYRRALDRAASLLAVREDGTAPVLGMSSAPDQVSLAAGWSLYDLGRPAEAAQILDKQVPGIRPTARRAKARFGVRRALAHALNGDIEHACSAVRDLLPDIAQVDSATIRGDLRDLARTLNRWHGDRAVREFQADLMPVLNVPS